MISSLLGLDNIAVAFALGPLQIGPRRTLLLGLSFGIAEAGMTLLGSVLGAAWLPTAMATELTRAGVLATLAVAVLGFAWVRRQPEALVASPRALMGLALLLGIDNLIAGAALDVAALSPAVIVTAGALTGALAAVACVAGSAVFRPAPRWGAVASSVMLLGLAVAGIV